MTSFIFVPPDSYDIEEEHKALEETTDCNAISNRVER
jgi:hypothetical protein